MKNAWVKNGWLIMARAAKNNESNAIIIRNVNFFSYSKREYFYLLKINLRVFFAVPDCVFKSHNFRLLISFQYSNNYRDKTSDATTGTLMSLTTSDFSCSTFFSSSSPIREAAAENFTLQRDAMPPASILHPP